MKKLYATLLCAVTAMAAYADFSLEPQAGIEAISAYETLQPSRIGKATKTAEQMFDAPTTSVLKAPAMKVFENEKWESMGTGSFTDFILSSVWGVDAVMFDVEVEKSTTTEGVYRIAEPYKNFTIPTTLVEKGVKYDAANVTPMYIVVEGNSFIVPEFSPGFSDADGKYVVLTQVGASYPEYSVATIANAYPDGVGIYNQGLLTYPIAMTANGSKYTNFLVYMGAPKSGLYGANRNGEFKIKFPGATAKDYSIAIEGPTVADSNHFTFSMKLGIDVAKYKLVILPGDYAASDANFKVVYENGQEFPATTKTIRYDASKDEGGLTFFAVSIDADGKLQEGTRTILYAVQPHADEWVACSEKAKYVDGILISAYPDAITEEYEVTIESSKEFPGYYRLVNAFAGTTPLAKYNFYMGIADQYIYIQASDPEKVYIEESPVGFEQNQGQVIVNSIPNFYMEHEKAVEDSSWGKLKDGVITMPAGSLMYRLPGRNGGQWYLADKNGLFKVTLPASLGIGQIINDFDASAPIEYFNLQGQRVANPAPGQILIRRQGKTIEKYIVK